MRPDLPSGKALEVLLGLDCEADVNDLVNQSLIDPLTEFLKRPGKKFRSRFVGLGYALAGAPKKLSPAETRLCRKAADVVEMIHAGSLVVDDIQDDSRIRRGKAAFHLRHGLPIALNAGNWLYFWPFEQIRSWGLDPRRELGLYRLCHETLLRAHFGQALDVGVPITDIPKARVPSVCLASLELKTGALMALGIGMGAILGNSTKPRFEKLMKFGHAFGVALQMFDDIGNFTLESKDPKRYEDLRLKRPSWIWATFAKHKNATTYRSLVKAVEDLPNDRLLQKLATREKLVSLAKKDAKAHLNRAVEALEIAVAGREDHSSTVEDIHTIAKELLLAYE